MKTALPAVQIIISVFLLILILLQAKGTGLGSAWGGSGELYRSKRGVEKILFYATIAFVVLFLLSSILGILFQP